MMAISKPVLQEVDGTVICTLTIYKEVCCICTDLHTPLSWKFYSQIDWFLSKKQAQKTKFGVSWAILKASAGNIWPAGRMLCMSDLDCGLTLFAPLSGEPWPTVALEEADLVPTSTPVHASIRTEEICLI